jgi:hypothetical protein
LAIVDEEPKTTPFVIRVGGEVAADGKAIALRIVRSEQSPVDLCLRAKDAQHLVGVLLALTGEAWRLRPQPDDDAPPSESIPLPLSAINVGQDDHDQTFLMLETGGTALIFGVQPSCLQEVGRTLLALSADTAGKPS